MSAPQEREPRDRLVEVVEGRLRSNGDWNVNDWRDAARVLTARLAAVEAARDEERKYRLETERQLQTWIEAKIAAESRLAAVEAALRRVLGYGDDAQAIWQLGAGQDWQAWRDEKEAARAALGSEATDA